MKIDFSKYPQRTSVSVMAAGALSLHVFWISNVLKEAFPGVKEWLNFYPPVGPLLGLFLLSLAAGILFWILTCRLVSEKAAARPAMQRTAIWFYLISAVLFALMVLPPIFEPLVHWLAGK